MWPSSEDDEIVVSAVPHDSKTNMSAERFSRPALACHSTHAARPGRLVTNVVPVPAHQNGQVTRVSQAERQHRARYPPNATGVSHTRTASASPPAAATAGERLSW